MHCAQSHQCNNKVVEFENLLDQRHSYAAAEMKRELNGVQARQQWTLAMV